MRIIVAPDSFKGSVQALAVAQAMERGIKRVFPDAQIEKIPVADGGEGTVAAMLAAVGGSIRCETVCGPLGEPVQAEWGLLENGEVAVIEMAAASGLPLVGEERRNPCYTTSYGTGELIKAALEAGVRKIILGLGGSATNDGGAGMMQALGVRFLDERREPLALGGAALAALAEIDLDGVDPRLKATEIIAACDVSNPLCGEHGASAIYGPQKGATPAMVAELDAALAHYAKLAAAVTGRDAAVVPGAGAAGGLGAGLLFFTEAKLSPGVEVVLATAHFHERVQQVDWVMTGEGRTDYQTVFGKAPVGVAQAAKQHSVPVICLSGSLGEQAGAVYEAGIDALADIVPRPMRLAECMEQGEVLLEEAAAGVCRVLAIGQKLGQAEFLRKK